MLELFTSEVQKDSARFGIPPPRVELVRVAPTWDAWAWTSVYCPPNESVAFCDTVISVRYDVLAFFGYDAVRLLALHEVIHARDGDQFRVEWYRTDPAAIAYQRRRHAQIVAEVDRSFDTRVLAAASRQVKLWNARWRKQ